MKSEFDDAGRPSEVEIVLSPAEPPSQLGVSPPTPDVFDGTSAGRSLIASSTLRHARRVSKQAALATKKQIWDSNDASIVAAQSAVDQWEQGYNGMRGLLMAMSNSARGLYGAAKAGATGLEHGFLVPVRDWVLLPSFGGVERIAGETVGFLQSSHAEQLARQSLDLVRQVPFVGENILAPAMCIGADVLKQSWEIAQYPIPSPSQVRDSVDFVMTGTKWALSTAGREVFLYVKRADANITRTLSHTRWKVLGSGPYATLDKLNKREVIDHLCERYFSLVDAVARYELAAHIRAHNRPLYHDLVFTGLLRERGGDLTAKDEWLSSCPSYRSLESPFLLDDETVEETFSIWFRLPYNNGKRPGKDTPWVRFDKRERIKLEAHYRSVLKKNKENITIPSAGVETSGLKTGDADIDSQKYATNAKWYKPDLCNDLLLDQKRHSVSFFPCCPKCRQMHKHIVPPLVPKQFGELCNACSERNLDAPWVDALLSPPPILAVYRPTMWRFYGPGDELRRASWFLDTQRHGLQPYGEQAQAVLEDAYLFLKWTARRPDWDGSALLTVQVPSPDRSEQQLVQFSSLTSATAIGKGLGSAIALFKRRVYRGAYRPKKSEYLDKNKDATTRKASEEVDKDIFFGEAQKDTEAMEDTPWADLDPHHDLTGQEGTNNLHNDMRSRLALPGETESEPAECLSDDGLAVPVESTPDPEPPSHENHIAEETDEIGPEERCNTEINPFERLDEPLSLAYAFDEPGEVGIPSDEDIYDDGGDNVDHLVLIVHGIGEMLQTIDFFGLSKLPTIVDCCGFLRKNNAEVLDVRFNQLYHTLDGTQQPRRGRVEYLPIEWHESFTIQSQRRLLTSGTSSVGSRSGNFTINDVSLRTIPQLRQFANDALMDVLYFMSPEHHDIIIDIVVNEMNFVVEKCRSLTGFSGDVSLLGHSLGSIITWDILDHQTKIRLPTKPIYGQQIPEMRHQPEQFNCEDAHVEDARTDPENVSPEQEDHCQALSKYPQLSFAVDNAFMLGSPIAVFLMIRNQRKPLSPGFTLSGCPRVFNIFHPYDPVAYRIEPLLDPRNAEFEPKIMTHWHGGFRFQYQTKRLWRKIVDETLKTQENVIEKFESGIAALGLLDGTTHELDEDEEEADSDVTNHGVVVTGCLNRGQRIDYMLQEKEIENANEYVAALAAHSCYWLEKDLSLFIARQICLRALERETGEETPFARHN